jgi:isopenicillin N synthase-like dioxygenase
VERLSPDQGAPHVVRARSITEQARRLGIGSVRAVPSSADGERGVPCIDVTSLVADGPRDHVVAQIDAACRTDGFFTIVGHGIDSQLQDRLDAAARAFFALDESAKAEVAMARGGRAWRGWFPVGGELTSGVADAKEGFYFGTDLPPDDLRVAAGTLLHGPNLWPAEPAELRGCVEAWMAAMADLATRLMEAIAVGLGLAPDWFVRHLTADPTVLLRIFRYPPAEPEPDRWGVAEHTDYGLLTILAQDDHGGLQVRGRDGWIDVPAEPGALVCNIGDMLDRMTGGRYRSTPHRVRASTSGERLSFPFFFDPGWDAEVRPLPLAGPEPDDDAAHRWDGTSLRDLSGTYGDYLSSKVAKVFPDLDPR